MAVSSDNDPFFKQLEVDPAADRYYQLSGEAPLGGILLMALGGVSCGVIFGVMYGVVTQLPLPGITHLIAGFILAASVGAVLSAFGVAGRIRSAPWAWILCLLGSFAAWYAAWVTHMSWVMSEPPMYWVTPIHFLGGVLELASDPRGIMNDVVPAGWMLWPFWGIEAFLIILCGASVGAEDLTSRPYCEQCGVWTEVTENAIRLEGVDDPEMLRAALEAGKYELFDLLRSINRVTEPEEPCTYFDVTIAACPACTQSDYLTVKHVVWTASTDSDGDTTLSSEDTDLVKNIHIPRSAYTHIQELSKEPTTAMEDYAEEIDGEEEQANSEPC